MGKCSCRWGPKGSAFNLRKTYNLNHTIQARIVAGTRIPPLLQLIHISPFHWIIAENEAEPLRMRSQAEPGNERTFELIDVPLHSYS